MKIEPAAAISGHFGVPGDKSISHRAALFNAIADGEALVENFLRGADCLLAYAERAAQDGRALALAAGDSTLYILGVRVRMASPRTGGGIHRRKLLVRRSGC